MKIKVLTVKQPWACLIIHGHNRGWIGDDGYKNVENRMWTTNYRGRLYIHAGKSWDSWAGLGLRELGILPAWAAMRKHFELDQGYMPRRHADEFAAIIGYVDLVDVVNNSASKWAEPGCYHWILANPVAIKPVPAIGKLGIWEFDLEENAG